jgi:hypothetical protein
MTNNKKKCTGNFYAPNYTCMNDPEPNKDQCQSCIDSEERYEYKCDLEICNAKAQRYIYDKDK